MIRQIISFALIAILLVSFIPQQANAISEITFSDIGTITDSSTDNSLNGHIWSTSSNTYAVTGAGATYNIYNYNHATSILTSDTGNEVFELGATTWDDPAVASSTQTTLHYNQLTRNNFWQESAINLAVGEKITTDSVLNGAMVDQIMINIGDVSAPSSGGVTIGVFDASGTILCTFGTATAASLGVNSDTTYTMAAGTFCTLDVDQYVGVKITTAFVSGDVVVGKLTSSSYDGTDSVLSTFNAATWTDSDTQDLFGSVRTVEGEYLLNDDVTDETKQYWRNNVNSESGTNFYMDLGSSEDVFSVDLYMQTASDIPAEIEITVSTDTTFNETPSVCELTASAGMQTCDITPATGQYVELLVSDWGSALRWLVNEADVNVVTNTATEGVEASEIDEDGDFFVFGTDGAGILVGMEVNLDGTVKNRVATDTTLGASLQPLHGVSSTPNRVWIGAIDDNAASDDVYFASYDRSLGDFVGQLAASGVCSTLDEDRLAFTTVAGETGAEDRAYAIGIDGGVATLCYDETDIDVTTVATTIGDAGDGLATMAVLEGKLLVWGNDDLWEITVLGHVQTQVRTTYPQTFVTQTFNQTASERTFHIDERVYVSDAGGYTQKYNASSGIASFAHTLITTVDGDTAEFTPKDTAKWYRINDDLVLEASTVGATTWTLKEIDSLANIEPTLYTERLGISLLENSTLLEEDVIRLICEDGLFNYNLDSPLSQVADDDDCTGWRVVATSSATVGREIFPYDNSPGLVHTDIFTGYTYEATATNVTSLLLKSRYESVIVDSGMFDFTGQVQQRYLYGQCYQVEVTNTVTSVTTILGTSCASDDTTKPVNLLGTGSGDGVSIPAFTPIETWVHSYSRNTTNTTNNWISFNLDHSERPWNASILVRDNIRDELDTINTELFNITNAEGIQEIIIPSTINGTLSISSNQTIYVTVFDESGDPVINVVIIGGSLNIEEPFTEILGSIVGLPAMAVVLVVLASVFTKSNSHIGIIVVLAAAGIMSIISALVIDPRIWVVVIIIAAIGIFTVKRSF